MVKKLFLFLIVVGLCTVMHAQSLAPVSWTAYGLTFDAPKEILVEEDTEDTFLLSNNHFYISLQALDSEDMTKEDLDGLLKGLADDDEVKEQSKVTTFDLKQFHGIWLKGIAEEDPCYYACLMTKDAGNVFLISIMYNRTEDKVVEKILNSFKMEE